MQLSRPPAKRPALRRTAGPYMVAHRLSASAPSVVGRLLRMKQKRPHAPAGVVLSSVIDPFLPSVIALQHPAHHCVQEWDSAISSGQLEVDFAGDQVGDRDESAQ